jgi:methyl-accepting chemotaxis protein
MLAKLRSSLSFQLVATGMIVLCIPIFFGLIYFPLQQKKSTMDGIQKYVQNRSSSMAASVAFALKNSNFDFINFAFRDALKDPDVVYVAILDESNSILVDTAINISVDKKSIGSATGVFQESDYLRYVLDATAEGKKYGRIVLQYSIEHTNAELNANIRMGAFLNIIILAIGVLILLVVMRRISRRIQQEAEGEKVYLDNSISRMLEQMEAFGRGELTTQLIAERDDNIARLYNSFNDLTVKVRNLLQEINHTRDAAINHQEYLSGSINRILEEMDRFAAGDLSISLSVDSDDDIGRLYDGFNRAVENIRTLVQQVRDAAESAASVATQLSAASTQMAATAEDQSRQSKTISFSISDMARTISDNNKQSLTAREQAIETSAVVESSNQKMKALERSSREIGEIISVINDITDQTNLLALNAAIEAARAGEAGRGFSVVADEVRKLSERTQQATKDVQEKIKQIQRDTANTTSMLEEINSRARNVSTTISSVADSSEKQARVSEDIAENIESMSSGSVQMSSSITEIARTIDDLSNLTVNLQGMLSQFRTERSQFTHSLGAGKSGRYLH